MVIAGDTETEVTANNAGFGDLDRGGNTPPELPDDLGENLTHGDMPEEQEAISQEMPKAQAVNHQRLKITML